MSEVLKPRKKNSNNHAPGYVYAVRNPDYPDDTKVGLTSNPSQRLRDHNTGNPMSTPNWRYTILKRVPDMKVAEDKILDFFYGTKYYLSAVREMLRGVSHEEMKTVFKFVNGEDIPESDFMTAPAIRPETDAEVVPQTPAEVDGYESPLEEKAHPGLLLQIKRRDKDGADLEWYGVVNVYQGIDCETTNKTYDSILKWNVAHALAASGNPKSNPSTYDAIRLQDEDGEWVPWRRRK